ncbi:hypothetical protein [Bacillus cereus]|uniref:hypothetical protein n=1 Tax=Bacillus cereus TaxID=1396 RepID=UPI001E5DF9EE|nr:hypothetical protein [Bacillus cereus]MCD2335728.1 hypothetical protein [Bacillus cereus]
MRKFPANSFVTRSQFGFGGGGGGQGSGQIIDKGAKQPIFFLFFNIPLLLSCLLLLLNVKAWPMC